MDAGMIGGNSLKDSLVLAGGKQAKEEEPDEMLNPNPVKLKKRWRL
jgi:hypothetical protein